MPKKKVVEKQPEAPKQETPRKNNETVIMDLTVLQNRVNLNLYADQVGMSVRAVTKIGWKKWLVFLSH